MERSEPAAAPPPGRLPGEVRVERLPGGLTLCLLSNRRAPVVTTALWYRAGTRDEPSGHGGVAHFLEHMMFKGSARYGPGEIDRRTQALGGDNNAFTSHDATAYHFNFAPDRWLEALAIEADRMTGLALDPDEVESERRVILEEVAMYEADPWDALEARVLAARFPGHAYGRPVLGTADELRVTGRAELASFHRRFYRPDNAVLAVAGDVGEEAVEAVVRAFAGVGGDDGGGDGGSGREPEWGPGGGRSRSASGGEARTASDALAPGSARSSAATQVEGLAAPPPGVARIERRQGEVARLLVALPAPAADGPEHAALRVAATLLGAGRASRLTRRLVDEEQVCTWVVADIGETAEPGSFTVAAELVPGVEPARVEDAVVEELAALAGGRRPATGDELARARRIAVADWVFAHERVHQQALAAGFALTLFDLGYSEREMARVLAVDGEALAAVAARWLAPALAVVGWSLPVEGRRPT